MENFKKIAIIIVIIALGGLAYMALQRYQRSNESNVRIQAAGGAAYSQNKKVESSTEN